MNRIAIVYSSRRGGTADLVSRIQNEVNPQNCDLINLESNPSPDLSAYAATVVGGPIYASNLHQPVDKFCKSNEKALLQKPLALFTCGMNEPEYQQQLESAFSETLRNHAENLFWLGGEFNFEKLNWIERFLVKRITGTKASVKNYKDHNIATLVLQMKQWIASK